MWKLAPGPLGDLDVSLTRALTYANGAPVYALSPAERGAVHAVYRLYEATLGQPHPDLRPSVLDTARTALHTAYNEVQIGGRLVDLRLRLLASADACPYCGFGEPRDLDHYLPRGVYGELAIYPHNLIPSCSPCNNAKRAVAAGDAKAPGFIHPYFQALPDQDFLKAAASFASGALQVHYQVDPVGLDPLLAGKLQYQVDRLKLNERYRERINTYLSEQRVAILGMARLGEVAVGDFLLASADSLAQDRGRNDWRVALLRALAADADFTRRPDLYLGPVRQLGA